MQLRSKITAFSLSAGLAVAGIAGLAGPAHAADTTTTFTLTGGALAVSGPASKSLGSVATDGGTTAAAQLGGVTVTDNRGALAATWTASVASTDFAIGGSPSAEQIIAKANASYWSGAQTAFTGTAVNVPGQLTVADKVMLDTLRTAFTASATVGNNSVTWNPTVNVVIPAQAVVGAYSGTITHSIA